MNAREMHYDFKTKLNKVDSQQNRNYLVPEIDWVLNEAQDIFVKTIAQPRTRAEIGFEFNQRTISDIRTIVINQSSSGGQAATLFDTGSYKVTLPTDYWFFINAKALCKKNTCDDVRLSIREVESDDENEISPFDRSSFEWRIANIRFIKEGIRIFTDNTFEVKKLIMEYLKEPVRIHNAQDFELGSGEYEDMNGVMLTGFSNCELPKMTHGEIVDLAVFLITSNLVSPEYSIKGNKLKITN